MQVEHLMCAQVWAVQLGWVLEFVLKHCPSFLLAILMQV